MAYPPINASPTKEFFINILVRDVTLVLAIAELVDNSVDGAKRLRGSDNFKGLEVKIQFDKDSFSIEDNCGGIPVDIATKYAFSFGPVEGAPSVKRPIGQFGVGMKRALFKIGQGFTIQSVAPDSSFLLKVNVDEWKSEEGKWNFKYDKYSPKERNKKGDCYTKISVAPLHDPIAAEFQLNNFLIRLVDTIQSQNSESLHQHLAITINGTPLHAHQPKLLRSSQIKPVHVSRTIKREVAHKEKTTTKTIKVDVYAGVSEAVLVEAGWYIFCNGRLVLRADRSGTTGWGERVELESDTDEDNKHETIKMPRAHWQFARFRGYVYFESDDGALLPWTTTKSDVDTESPIYQAVKLDMIWAMRQVIDFLNKVDLEMESGGTFLEGALEKAKEASVRDLPLSAKFVFPQPKKAAVKLKTQRISYEKPIEEFDRVKELLDVSTPKEVGESTFEYYMQMEGDSE